MDNLRFLSKKNELRENEIQKLHAFGKEICLVQQGDTFFAFENKCGHFGLPLDDGRLKDASIVCTHHGIEFSLKSGENINRPWEDCEKVACYKIHLIKDEIWIEIPN